MHRDGSTPRRVRVAEGIYRESGSWIAGYRCPITGKWTTKALKGVRTLTEAKKARRALLADLEARRATPSSKQAVSALADESLVFRTEFRAELVRATFLREHERDHHHRECDQHSDDNSRVQ